MSTTSDRGDILAQARRIVIEDGRLSPRERQDLLELINSLAESSQPIPALRQPSESQAVARPESSSASHALLSLLKQQADELDALKKLSLNLTSSLDLPSFDNSSMDGYAVRAADLGAASADQPARLDATEIASNRDQWIADWTAAVLH